MKALCAQLDFWQALPIPAIISERGSGRILDVNASAEQFFNQSASRLSTETLPSLLGEEVMQSLQGPAQSATSDIPNIIDGIEIMLRDAPPRLCTLHLSLLSAKETLPEGILCVLSPREFGSAARQNLQSAAAANSAIGMAAMLSHEIRNPLAGIAGAAQLISMSYGKEVRELTDLILAETRRVDALIERFSEFGTMLPKPEGRVNLHDVLMRAKRSAELGFAAHMVFSEDFDPSLPEARGDGDALVQVLLNLFRNAAEAQPDGGQITLRTAYAHSRQIRRSNGSQHGDPLPLIIEIEDDGPGIPADLKEIVFDPFISGKTGGTGLGLALVAKIISSHEGWINITSNPGSTKISIALPRA